MSNSYQFCLVFLLTGSTCHSSFWGRCSICPFFEDFLRAMKEDAAVANLGVAMCLVAPLLCVMALFYMAAWWHRWSLVEFPKSMGYLTKSLRPMAASGFWKRIIVWYRTNIMGWRCLCILFIHLIIYIYNYIYIYLKLLLWNLFGANIHVGVFNHLFISFYSKRRWWSVLIWKNCWQMAQPLTVWRRVNGSWWSIWDTLAR